MNIEQWALQQTSHRVCTSTEFMYDEMESQSGRSLPVIYKSFDPRGTSDWNDEGCILDFVACVGAQESRILDFGPGDGWPALRIAPFVGEVVGVDSSERRVAECERNASRLGIENAQFVKIETARGLPFEDETFDGITAASSLEQTPDVAETVRELFRVLRPGGKLRISYEGLKRYSGDQERIGWIGTSSRSTVVDMYDRDIDRETALMVRICTSIDKTSVAERLSLRGQGAFQLGDLTSDSLSRLEPEIDEVRICRLRHPSGSTFVGLLEKAGFIAVGTHNGAEVARALSNSHIGAVDLTSHTQLTEYLRPIVGAVVAMEAPLSGDPWILASKPTMK